MNKTDAYINFDPTQIEGGCCGEVQFDNTTLSWKRQPEKTQQVGEDCSKVQQQLDQANAVVADQNRLLEQKTNEVAEALDKATEAETKLAELEKKVADLEAKLANQPTECDILEKHLDPIYRLNGELIGYGIKNPPECLKNVEPVTGLNPNNEIGNIVTPPVEYANEVEITYD